MAPYFLIILSVFISDARMTPDTSSITTVPMYSSMDCTLAASQIMIDANEDPLLEHPNQRITAYCVRTGSKEGE